MEYDVRIDECGDVWVVYPSPGGRKVEVNKTRIDAYRAPAPAVVFDELWTYNKMMRDK